jgi:hypothetical protein
LSAWSSFCANSELDISQGVLPYVVIEGCIGRYVSSASLFFKSHILRSSLVAWPYVLAEFLGCYGRATGGFVVCGHRRLYWAACVIS